MSKSWDEVESEGPEVPEIVHEMVRAAVTYGYRRGIRDAGSETEAAEAHEVAEEFLRKSYLEQFLRDEAA